MIQLAMAHNEEIGLFFDAQGSIRASIDLCDLCEVEINANGTASDVVKTPYSLRLQWRSIIAHHTMDDVLYIHPLRLKIQDLLLVQDRFIFLTQDKNGCDENCSRATTFRQKLESTIASNTTFRVAIQLYGDGMAALRLHPRDYMAGPTQFNPLPPVGVLTRSKSEYTPSPAPNKLETKETMELKLFMAKQIQNLSLLTDI
jgi:hypothetical protein